MKKRTKKPPVKLEVARQWLRRHEEGGESVPKIAEADDYDVRTVRKQLERARSEREVREAKQVVLRGALERHYADLCSFAEKLKADLSGDVPTNVSMTLRDDPMWRALHEHLPRLRLWTDIEKWRRLAPEYEKSVERCKEHIQSEAASRVSLEFVSSAKSIGLNDEFTDGLAFHLQAAARDGQGLKDTEYYLLNTKRGVRVRLGAYMIALVPEDKVKDVQGLFNAIMDEALDWEEYSVLKKCTEEFLKAKRGIHEELTKIILRRIIPGRCVYCPF